MECSLGLLVVKDGFAVLERDGGHQFLFPLPSGIKWEGEVVVHLPPRCRRGSEVSFLSFVAGMVEWERTYLTP